jgi:integrase
MRRNHTTFVKLAERYLAERRAMGFDLRIAGNCLLTFARFADGRSRGPLSVPLAVAWAQSAPAKSQLTWGRRLEIVRPFATWLCQHDPRTEVPPTRYFGRVHRRLPPHVYSEPEVLKLLRAAARLTPHRGLRPVSVATLLGLLACTGMRVSEALALRREHVDLGSALLLVRRTKFHKSRLVPIHPTAVRALRRFVTMRDRSPSGRTSDAFFVSDGGVALSYSKVRTAFLRLRIQLGWEDRRPRRPRIHDLRHTFACRRLLRWHQQRIDADRHILDLSTYLGHAKASDTYWYLSGFPELMHLAAQRFEHFARAGTEVRS